MSVSLWCLLAAAVLPILAGFPGKMDKRFDNANPRDPEWWREGLRARAWGAMANGYEAFPFFAAAVLVGLTQGADRGTVDALALLVIAARVVYTLCYWADRATLRSIVWVIGFAATTALMLTPIWAPA